MLILKHGSALMTKECLKCKCVFAFNFHDIGEEWQEDDTGHYVGTAYICCPECGNEIRWPIREKRSE